MECLAESIAYFACSNLLRTAVRSARKPRGMFFKPNHFWQRHTDTTHCHYDVMIMMMMMMQF